MRVAILGNGQLGTNLARIVRGRSWIELIGPMTRADREKAVASGADVVVIATTSFLTAVAEDIRTSVIHGSNVIVSAEEAAYPWAVDAALADDLHALALHHGVTILGAGVNPGFAFDGLVVACTGPTAAVDSLSVERVADLSGFGTTVLRRIGVGYEEGDFLSGVEDGRITGHIGFPQSMQVVAAKLGRKLDRVEPHISPIIATRRHQGKHISVEPGQSAGFEQRYVGICEGRPWFTAMWIGHLELSEIGRQPRDEIWVHGEPDLHYLVEPGFNAQTSTPSIIANSFERVVTAKPGWQTVADLPPAHPRSGPAPATG
jgi:hypothetical protein